MLLACMCNQPQRLGEALAPLGLAVPGPVGRWAMAWVHGGEILVARTPRPTEGDLALGPAMAEPHSDCVLVTARPTSDAGDPDDLPPFRFRRWMLSEDPTLAIPAEAWAALVSHVPDFLRRNLRGRTTAELTLHTIVALLHDQGRADDLTLRIADLARVVVEATSLVRDSTERAGLTPSGGVVAASNSRALAIVARDQPLAIHALHVTNDRGQRDPSFRGVLVTAGMPPTTSSDDPDARVPELVPAGSLVTVSRDLHLTIAPLGR
ncbi:MAG: hypothetical protein IPL61_38840 [Myxococcales bacterium]|nr:hypothetical protein [Myxococcales bacterium]